MTTGLYWFGAAFFTFFDVTNWPKFIRKYKTQPGQNEPLPMKRVFGVSLTNTASWHLDPVPLDYFSI